MKPAVLIVDDEKNIRRMFEMVLRSAGFDVRTAESGEAALAAVEERPADVVLLDVRLPDRDGLDVLRALRARRSDQVVVMVSGHGTIGTAVEATREGAFDFLEKPVSKERLTVAVRNAARLRTLDRDLRTLRERDRRRRAMVGESRALQAIREQIARVGPTQARVLISGESGTGKELVARALHEASPRANGPFVKVNCAAIPEELIESELFGAVKGAYTGATESRDGKFLQADGGTLFLDEVGDMSARAQAKVLRALQEGEIERVGGAETVRVDVRVIAATNKDLAADAAAERFRSDLLFRLAVVPIVVPPLRERREDVPLLAEHLLGRYLEENGLPPRTFAPEALRFLQELPWPGNVRELGNVVERLAILAPGPTIGPEETQRLAQASALPVAPASGGSAADTDLHPLEPAAVQRLGGLVAARQRFEAACIEEALRAAAGNVSRAARLLGIDRTNLHKKIQAYGLEVDRARGGEEDGS